MVYLKQALERDPSLVDAHLHLGKCLSSLGRIREAAESYRRVLDLDAIKSKARTYLDKIEN